MVKNELIKSVANKVESTTQKQVEAVLKAYAEVVKDELAKGEEIIIIDLGKFAVVDKAERIGRNPKTGEEVTIPAKKAVKFKPSKDFKESIN